MKNLVKAGVICTLLVVLDQLVKLWVLATLKGKDPIVLIENILEFRYLENRGAAFGILQNQLWFFVIITVFVLVALILVVKRMPDNKRFLWLRICIYLIGAGAVGNMIDRVFRRYVVDFIYFKLIDFPIFNVADIYVTCAAFLMVVLVMFYYKDEELDMILTRKKKEAKKES